MIPDFEVITKSYINCVSGDFGRRNVFDLYQLYRYTHGNPEMTPTYWLEQLHKSLFVQPCIQEMLFAVGFKNWAIFNYCYPSENIPINLGFVAWKNKPVDQLSELKQLFSLFSKYFANIDEPLSSTNLLMSESLKVDLK